MDRAKRKRLEAAGWKFETVEEFLNLTPDEARLIELRLALSKALKDERRRLRLTQVEAAKRLNTTQPRVSRMESGDPSVSLEAVFQSLFKLGATNKSLAKTIGTASAAYAA
ncbi:XRE family transcriptional regulator [bacterium]|nr:XRE family transcriptional regulator [bacterium]